MNKRTVVFKKCCCKDFTRKTIIVDNDDKFSVYHVTRCDGCRMVEVFPDNLKCGDGWEYNDGRRFIEWETRNYKAGSCYLYEEEKI